ncbi:MAG TPA: protein-disulfide reductase DsbD [Woeseiaceae bacterium]|nr:protein-disulfide reductase DsbD [Woeseiaceae bacterium]
MKRIHFFVTALLFLLPASLALAADDRPLPPQEVFHYVVADTGDALEIDWAVNEGAYMYRDAFGFTVNSDAVVLGVPELPVGEVHSDEFLGEQVVYRGNFFVRIPYSIQDSTPATVDLTIKSRGCLDAGFCYLPQSWTETVKLKSAAAGEKKLSFGSIGGNSMDDALPADQVFKPDAFAIDGNTIEFGVRLLPDYYLYKSKISVRSLSDKARAGQLDLPKGKQKTDEWLGEQEVYFDEVFGRVAIARATPDAMDLDIELSYQGCKVDGICYLPVTKTLTVSLPEATTTTDLSTIASSAAPVSEQARLAQIITESSIWAAAGLFFLAGLGLAFTPCVLPMVPILSGIIAGDGDNVSPMRGFMLALSYVLGMAIVYTVAGVAAAAAGLQLQATFNQPWILILFASLFVALALGMFGAYDLQMPSGLQSKLSSISGNQKSGTVIGAFVMGALSALIVTACVAPALIAALTVIAQTGDMLRGGSALFAMSLGMGAPLLLVGAAQGKLLPKAGGWMVAVKNAFGFMMLALAIWMLSRILPGTVTMLLWAVLVFMAGVFMGGLTTLTRESGIAEKLGKGFGFLSIIYGVILLLGSLTGGSNPLQPLASVNLNGGAAIEEQHELPFKRIKSVDDLDKEIAMASAAGNTVLLDFYADWCVSCLEMEAYTFSDSDVQAALSNTVWLQADVTDNDPIDQALLQRFGVFGPPTIIFFGLDGQQRHGYEVVGYMKASDFANHVRQAFAVSDSIAAQNND